MPDVPPDIPPDTTTDMGDDAGPDMPADAARDVASDGPAADARDAGADRGPTGQPRVESFYGCHCGVDGAAGREGWWLMLVGLLAGWGRLARSTS